MSTLKVAYIQNPDADDPAISLPLNGKVGIGVTNPITPLDIKGPAEVRTFLGTTFMGCLIRGAAVANGDYSGLDFMAGSGTPTARIAARYTGNGSSLCFGVSDNYAAGITKEAMTIAPGGQVGIGTQNPSRAFVVSNGGTSGVEIMGMNISSQPGGSILAYNRAANGYVDMDYDAAMHIFFSSGVEMMRTDTSQRLLIGAQGPMPINGKLQIRYGGAGGQYGICLHPAGGDDTCPLWFFNAAQAGVGSIQTSATATAYLTSSDYRLKEDVKPVEDPIIRLKALKPVNFAWKTTGKRVDGFLAHEAQEVVPDAVSGTKDAVDAEGSPAYQGIDQAKLIPLLTAALQEALKRIEVLEAKVVHL